MRRIALLKRIFLLAIGLCFVTPVLAQKKNKIRVKAQIIQMMDQGAFIEMAASSRIDGRNVAVTGVVFNIDDITHSKRAEIGAVTTDENGKAIFAISEFNTMKPDSTGLYKIQVAFDGNDDFSKVKKSIEFKKAVLSAEIIQKDSLNYIQAKLLDGVSLEPVADEILTTHVQRLFRPLRVGDEFNTTDESGIIEAKIPNDIPGINGLLNLEVVLLDNDDYGTVKKVVAAPIGVKVQVDDRFNQRAIWATRDKTPIFMLVFTNLLLLGIAILFIYLTRNLINIYKS